MRIHVLSMLVACAMWSLALDVARSQEMQGDAAQQDATTNVGGQKAAHEGAAITRARDLAGIVIYGADKESLGKIEDVVVDPRTGKVRYAVLSFGRVIGLGDNYFAIPWQKLTFVPKGKMGMMTEKEGCIILDVSKETLKNAPKFNKENWPNFSDKNTRKNIEQYYQTDAEHDQLK